MPNLTRSVTDGKLGNQNTPVSLVLNLHFPLGISRASMAEMEIDTVPMQALASQEDVS